MERTTAYDGVQRAAQRVPCLPCLAREAMKQRGIISLGPLHSLELQYVLVGPTCGKNPRLASAANSSIPVGPIGPIYELCTCTIRSRVGVKVKFLLQRKSDKAFKH